MTCQKCNLPNADGARFCSGCGSELFALPVPAVQAFVAAAEPGQAGAFPQVAPGGFPVPGNGYADDAEEITRVR